MIQKLDSVPKERLADISRKRIFFGHQSVGGNILSGFDALNQELPSPLAIKEIAELDTNETHYLCHTKIGQNKNPLLKITDFKEKVNGDLKGKVDVAFLKFCYVDINRKTNVEEVFNSYVTTMQVLKEDNPNVQFVHFTVPIRRIEKGMKATIKKLMGKNLEIEDNLVRMKYNQMLIDTYQGKEPIFDLAKVQSTMANGSQEFGYLGKEKVYALVPEYASDLGHLNDQGSKYVGEQLLVFLSNLDLKPVNN
ncbi:MAG: GSCFA domain-containing protein [Bacteroidales bacterium]|nr:GSCFA domain-containing protein [Bacteroidales bacterium]